MGKEGSAEAIGVGLTIRQRAEPVSETTMAFLLSCADASYEGLKPEAAGETREVRLGALKIAGIDVMKGHHWQEPPWYGTVCQVVWEVGGGDPASYPI